MLVLKIVSLYFTFLRVKSLDNGLALTPPMGWTHWQRFRCVTDCEIYPDECISERLFRSIADEMQSGGYMEAGYQYLIIDDCWSAKNRDANGKLQPDPDRFPNGIKNLSNYVHSKSLKLGIYADYGTLTCAGYPGSINHLKADAKTFADWEIDYLKLDACYSQGKFEEGYTKMRKYLNITGRPIMLSCSYPAYQEPYGKHADYAPVMENCNLWRNYEDIDDSWHNVTHIVNWYISNHDRIAKFSGPGHWNDPDNLIIGNYGLSLQQSKAQMTIWCILAVPLIMTADLRTIEPQFRVILLNKDAIAINQDPLGIMGKLVITRNFIYVWLKQLQTGISGQQFAIGVVSYRVNGLPFRFEFSLNELGIGNSTHFWVKNVFDENQPTEDVNEFEKIYLRIKPSEGILLHVTPHKKFKRCHIDAGLD